MKIYITAFTDRGNQLKQRIKAALTDCEMVERANGLGEFCKTAFSDGDAIIFIGAAGIAIRAISPYLTTKDRDPAVVVCDELGQYAISLLSGHLGGANALAQRLEDLVGTTAVITTATDLNGVWAVDNFAKEKGFKIHNLNGIKHISAALLRRERVGITADVNLDTAELPHLLDFNDKSLENGIVISPFIKKVYKNTLNLVPQCLAIGVGARKNADLNALVDLFDKVMTDNNIDKNAVFALASLDLKCDEQAVLCLADRLGVVPQFYTADRLNSVNGNFTSSAFVSEITGTDNVCERCAVLAADNGRLIVKKTAQNGVTLAIALKE